MLRGLPRLLSSPLLWHVSTDAFQVALASTMPSRGTCTQPRLMCAGPATPGAKKAAQSLAQRPESHRSYQEFQRSRAKLLRSVSQRRAQSTAVDFRRIWWDKDRRGASRTGMSIWRPLPPTGYISLGMPP